MLCFVTFKFDTLPISTLYINVKDMWYGIYYRDEMVTTALKIAMTDWQTHGMKYAPNISSLNIHNQFGPIDPNPKSNKAELCEINYDSSPIPQMLSMSVLDMLAPG